MFVAEGNGLLEGMSTRVKYGERVTTASRQIIVPPMITRPAMLPQASVLDHRGKIGKFNWKASKDRRPLEAFRFAKVFVDCQFARPILKKPPRERRNDGNYDNHQINP
jgi:hypothetical protein